MSVSRDRSPFIYFSIIFIALFHRSFTQCRGNVIWNKQQQAFVNFHANEYRFVALKETECSKEEEENDNGISGESLLVSYYEDTDLVEFYDNDTRVTGICGEIWNLLADYLNFTLVPVKYQEHNFGIRLNNGSYTGLMGLLEQNGTQVILRTGYYTFRGDLFDYSMPVWNIKYQLFIKPEYKYDDKWLLTMFTIHTWYALIFLFSLLSLVGYAVQQKEQQNYKYKKKLRRSNEYHNLKDHIFYTYSMMCGQGYLPKAFHDQNKILSLSKSIFAWMTLLTFSVDLIYRMTNRKLIPPFTNFENLLNGSNYDVLIFKGSMIYEFMKDNLRRSRRFHLVNDIKLIYENICYNDKLFAVLETREKLLSRNKYFCPVTAMGKSYYHTWIGFGLSKNFPYRRIIDRSLIKLHETGLLTVLKRRWLHNIHTNYNIRNPFKMIDIEQVQLIFIIPCIGIVLSLIVLTVENIIFFYTKEQRNYKSNY